MATLAKRLFDYYPAQDVGDPRVVMAGMIELFEHYPPEIVLKVISPVYGIPGKFKFLPRFAEIKEVLDGFMPKEPPPRIYPVFESLPPPDRSKRPTYEELRERCARAGLIIGKGTPGVESKARAARDFRERHGLSEAEWNAIPDARSRQ